MDFYQECAENTGLLAGELLRKQLGHKGSLIVSFLLLW